MRPSSPPAPTDSPIINAVPWLFAVAGGVVLVVWAGATVALLASGGGAVTLADAAEAITRLPDHLSDPSTAWPAEVQASFAGPVLYWSAQLLVVLVALALLVIGLRSWRRWGHRSRPLGVEPDVGIARRVDLRPLAIAEPMPGRVTIGHSRARLLATEPDASLAVIGPTGCGKTAGFAIPALLEWDGPVLATSVKGDLIDATVAHRRRCGKVWVYDPSGSSGQATASWSPLGECRTWGGAMRVAAWMTEAAQTRSDAVADGDYWNAQARKALAPYLHAAAVTGGGITTLVRWIDRQEQSEVEDALLTAARVDPATGEIRGTANALEERQLLLTASIEVTRSLLAEQGDAAADLDVTDWPPALLRKVTAAVEAEWAIDQAPPNNTDPLAPLTAARALWVKEARLRGAAFATVEAVLDGWSDPGVGAAGAGADAIDFDEWLRGDNTIYLTATAHEQARLRPVLTTLLQMAIRRAYDTAATNGGRLAKPCLLLLDEAGNTVSLRDLPGYAATARSHGITLISVWQDLSQVRAIYRDRAPTVLNNHRAKLIGSGVADLDTLDYVSRLVGDQARTERSFSADVNGAGRRSVNEHRAWRRAAPADVLRRIRPGEGVLLYGSVPPAHVRLRPWFDDRRLRSRAAEDAGAAR